MRMTEATHLMLIPKDKSLPVVDENQAVEIITEKDIFWFY